MKPRRPYWPVWVVMAILALVVIMSVVEQSRFQERCEARGGYVIQVDKGYVCLSSNGQVIEVKE